jgi:hypothetical protein
VLADGVAAGCVAVVEVLAVVAVVAGAEAGETTTADDPDGCADLAKLPTTPAVAGWDLACGALAAAVPLSALETVGRLAPPAPLTLAPALSDAAIEGAEGTACVTAAVLVRASVLVGKFAGVAACAFSEAGSGEGSGAPLERVIDSREDS